MAQNDHPGIPQSQQLLDCTLHPVLTGLCSHWKESKQAPNCSRYFHNSFPTGRGIKQWLPLSRNWMSCSSSGCSGSIRHLGPLPPPSGTAGSDEAPLVTRTPLHHSENSAAAGELQGKDTRGNNSVQGSGSALAHSCTSSWGREGLAAAAWHLLNLKGQHDEGLQDVGRGMPFASIPPACRKQTFYTVKCCELCAHRADALSFVSSISTSNLPLHTVHDSQKVSTAEHPLVSLANQPLQHLHSNLSYMCVQCEELAWRMSP